QIILFQIPGPVHTEIKVLPFKTTGNSNVIPRCSIPYNGKISMVSKGSVSLRNFTVPVPVYILHVTRTPGWINFGLVGHGLSFCLYQTIRFKSPDLPDLFSFVPVIDKSVFIPVFQNLGLMITQAQLYIIGKIAADHFSPSQDQFESFRGKRGIVGSRCTCTEGIRQSFLRTKHVRSFTIVHIKSDT